MASQTKPPVLTAKWIRTTVALTVSVAIGLAPFLGVVGIPLFSTLLSLLPMQIRNEAITVSTAFMAIIAVFVQWHEDGRVGQTTLDRWFRRGAVSAIVSLVILLVMLRFFVVRVPYLGGSETISFLKGFVRPHPDVCAGMGDVSCIQNVLTFNPSAIESYWGDLQSNLSGLVFLVFYVSWLSSISFLVGLLVIRQQKRRRG